MLSTCHEGTSGFPPFSGGQGGALRGRVRRAFHTIREGLWRWSNSDLLAAALAQRRDVAESVQRRRDAARKFEQLNAEPEVPSHALASMLAEF